MALLQVKGLIIFSLWCRQALARLEVDAHQRVFRGGLKDQEVQSVLVSRKTTRQRIAKAGASNVARQKRAGRNNLPTIPIYLYSLSYR